MGLISKYQITEIRKKKGGNATDGEDRVGTIRPSGSIGSRRKSSASYRDATGNPYGFSGPESSSAGVVFEPGDWCSEVYRPIEHQPARISGLPESLLYHPTQPLPALIGLAQSDLSY